MHNLLIFDVFYLHPLKKQVLIHYSFKNRLVSPKEGSFTLKFPHKEEKFIYDAAMEYIDEGRPLVSKENECVESLGLTGSKTFFIRGIEDLSTRKMLPVQPIIHF